MAVSYSPRPPAGAQKESELRNDLLRAVDISFQGISDYLRFTIQSDLQRAIEAALANYERAPSPISPPKQIRPIHPADNMVISEPSAPPPTLEIRPAMVASHGWGQRDCSAIMNGNTPAVVAEPWVSSCGLHLPGTLGTENDVDDISVKVEPGSKRSSRLSWDLNMTTTPSGVSCLSDATLDGARSREVRGGYSPEAIDKWERLFSKFQESQHSSVSKLHRDWIDARIMSFTDLLATSNPNNSAIRLAMHIAKGHSINDPRQTDHCERSERFMRLARQSTKAVDFKDHPVMSVRNRVSRIQLIMHPFCKKRILWDLIGMFFCLHDVLMLPMQVFSLPDGYQRFKDAYDRASAAFWSLDILITFLTGYVSREGLVEMTFLKIAKNYIKTWLPVDLPITLADWVSVFLTIGGTGYLRFGKTGTRIVRALRLLRLPKMGRSMSEVLGTMNSETMTTICGAMRLLVTILVMNHYIACVWYWIATECSDCNSWVHKYLDADPAVGIAYSMSLHWALTQFMPASMEVHPVNLTERVWTCIVIVVAMVVFSSFVSSITQAMTHLRMIREREIRQEFMIRKFFSTYHIPRELAGRVKYFIKQHNMLRGRHIKTTDVAAFDLLPLTIQHDLKEEAFLPFLCVHPLFCFYTHAAPVSMREICNKAVEEMTLVPMEDVFHTHSCVDRMLFVMSGGLEYAHEEDHIGPIFVEKGGWACEECLWASGSMLSGTLIAQLVGAECIGIIPDGFRTIVCDHRNGIAALIKYGELFCQEFNKAGAFEHSVDLLFNHEGVIEDILDAALNSGSCSQTVLSSKKKRRRGGFRGGASGSSGRYSGRSSMLDHMLHALPGFHHEGARRSTKNEGHSEISGNGASPSMAIESDASVDSLVPSRDAEIKTT